MNLLYLRKPLVPAYVELQLEECVPKKSVVSFSTTGNQRFSTIWHIYDFEESSIGNAAQYKRMLKSEHFIIRERES